MMYIHVHLDLSLIYYTPEFHDSDDWNYSEDFSTADHHDDPMPSLYSVKQRISSDAWEGVRELLRMACVESHILPENQVCVACSSTEANIWCRRCGANAFFCEECWRASHERVNIFHVPEFWEVTTDLYVLFSVL